MSRKDITQNYNSHALITMKIKRMNKIFRLLMPNVSAITLAPFGIFHRDERMNINTLNHELIHWEQQVELLIIFFYFWYFIEWIIKIPGSMFLFTPAYFRISFEREAYLNDTNKKYINTRKRFAWFKYIIKK